MRAAVYATPAMTAGVVGAAFLARSNAYLSVQSVACTVIAGAILCWRVPAGRALSAGWGLWALGGAGAALAAGNSVAFQVGLHRDLLLLAAMALGQMLVLESRAERTHAGWLLLAGGAVASAWGVLQLAGRIGAPVDPYGRVDAASALGLSNFTAEWSVVLVVLAGAIVGLRRRLWWCAVALVLVYAVWAGARAALAGAASAAVVAFARRRAKVLWPALAGLIAVAVCGLWLLRDDPAVLYRLLLWGDGVRAWLAVPWGNAPGAFPEAVDPVLSSHLDQISWERNIAIMHPHALWLEALTERGIVGFAGLAVWIFAGLRRRSRSLPALAAFAAIAAFSVVSRVPALWVAGGLSLGAALPAVPRQPGWRLRGPILLAVGVALVYALRTVSVELPLRNGLAAARSGNDGAARALVATAAARDRRGRLALFNHGLLQWRTGRPEVAANAFARLARRDPGFARAHELLSLSAWAAGDARRAARAAEMWRHLPGYRDPALYWTGVRAHLQLGQTARAASLLRQGLQEHPEAPALMRLRGSWMHAPQRQ